MTYKVGDIYKWSDEEVFQIVSINDDIIRYKYLKTKVNKDNPGYVFTTLDIYGAKKVSKLERALQ